MSKQSNKDQKETLPAEPEQKSIEKNESGLMASRIFVEKLKKEKDNNKISTSVFVAFVSVAPKADTEENYRKLWKKTFKRD